MAKISLTPQTALGGTEPRIDEFDTVSIAENINCSLASLALRDGKERGFNAAAKRIFKSAPPKPGKMHSAGDFTMFWSGPEQWFAEAPVETHEDIAAILQAEFKENASITEQTGGWVRFDLTGPDCVSVLERICAVDSAAMAKNSATRSVIEHIGVFVLCRKAKTQFTIYGPRSSAESLHHALILAAKSVI